MPPNDDTQIAANSTEASQLSDASTNPENGGPETPPFFRDFSQKFEKWQSDIEGRLTQVGKDFGKMRSRIDRSKGSDSPEAQGSDPAKDAKGSDSLSTLKLGRLLAQLPESAATELEDMLEAGASVRDVADRADLLKRHLDAVTADDKKRGDPKKTPPGRAATAPATTSKVHPTWTEWLQMNKDANNGDTAAERRLRELEKDPTFNPDPHE